jgi:hypothetical protein
MNCRPFGMQIIHLFRYLFKEKQKLKFSNSRNLWQQFVHFEDTE